MRADEAIFYTKWPALVSTMVGDFDDIARSDLIRLILSIMTLALDAPLGLHVDG
jgi:hypothetical protein